MGPHESSKNDTHNPQPVSKRTTNKRPDQDAPSRPRSRWKVWWTLLLIVPAAFVFTAADHAANAVPCRALDIEVDQMEGMYFVDAPTLHTLITSQYNLLDQAMPTLPLAELHQTITQQNGVASCEIEPTLGGALNIKVTQQRPIARVWLPDSVLYLDETGRTLALSPRYTADVPVLHAPDLTAARATMPLLKKMDREVFWDLLIDQLEVDLNGDLTIRPRIGDMVVELGQTESLGAQLDARLDRLRNFYSALITRGDLRQYRRVSLQYDGQLVASK